jgi:hypothetical protein
LLFITKSGILDSKTWLTYTTQNYSKTTASQILLPYVLRIVKATNFIHYEKWYNVLNNLINLYKALLKKIVALTMLHILQAPTYFNDHHLLCYPFLSCLFNMFSLYSAENKKITSCIIVWWISNMLPLLAFSIWSTFPLIHCESGTEEKKGSKLHLDVLYPYIIST